MLEADLVATSKGKIGRFFMHDMGDRMQQETEKDSTCFWPNILNSFVNKNIDPCALIPTPGYPCPCDSKEQYRFRRQNRHRRTPLAARLELVGVECLSARKCHLHNSRALCNGSRCIPVPEQRLVLFMSFTHTATYAQMGLRDGAQMGLRDRERGTYTEGSLSDLLHGHLGGSGNKHQEHKKEERRRADVHDDGVQVV